MNINISQKSICFEQVEVGDILLTSTGQTLLIVMDIDGDFTATNLTDNTTYHCCFDTLFALCEDIEDMEECQIIKRVPHYETILSVMEAI